jgi:hypothetical protein
MNDSGPEEDHHHEHLHDDTFVASVAHHIGPYNVVTSLFHSHSYFELRSLDHRSYRTWKTQLGLIHVAAMYAKANITSGDKHFWTEIAKSIEMKEVEITTETKTTTMEVTTANCQHICYFPIIRLSAAREGYLIHQVSYVLCILVLAMSIFRMNRQKYTRILACGTSTLLQTLRLPSH